MKEVKDIIEAAGRWHAGGKGMVLATLVHLEGSSYRRPGARMLVSEEGELTGAISGGCLEGDALRKALMVLAEGRARMVTYDTTIETDDPLGVGLGCNGIVRILMEPVEGPGREGPLALLQRAAAARARSVMVTFFSREGKQADGQGCRLLLEADGTLHGQVGGGISLQVVLKDAKDVLLAGKSGFFEYDTGKGSLSAFVECIDPPVALVIVGAGNDAIPLRRMAAVLGWETTVIDGRASHATGARFGAGCRVILANAAEALDDVAVDGQTAIVLMTHNYHYDKAVLKALLMRGDVRYIGMLGPVKKRMRMLEELRSEGTPIDTASMAALHAPVGLDIGAETPEEIALSILAEIRAALLGRRGGSLREAGDSIHHRDAARMPPAKND